jgi:hypothetical protein
MKRLISVCGLVHVTRRRPVVVERERLPKWYLESWSAPMWGLFQGLRQA